MKTQTTLGQLEDGGGGDTQLTCANLCKLHSYAAKRVRIPNLGSPSAGTPEEAFLAFRPDMRLILPFSRQWLHVKLRVLLLHEENQSQRNTSAKLRQNHPRRVLGLFLGFFLIRKARRSRALNSRISEESAWIAEFCHAQIRKTAVMKW